MAQTKSYEAEHGAQFKLYETEHGARNEIRTRQSMVPETTLYETESHGDRTGQGLNCSSTYKSPLLFLLSLHSYLLICFDMYTSPTMLYTHLVPTNQYLDIHPIQEHNTIRTCPRSSWKFTVFTLGSTKLIDSISWSSLFFQKLFCPRENWMDRDGSWSNECCWLHAVV